MNKTFVLIAAIMCGAACAKVAKRESGREGELAPTHRSATAHRVVKMNDTMTVTILDHDSGQSILCDVSEDVLVFQVVRYCIYPANRLMAEAQAGNLYLGAIQLPANSKLGDQGIKDDATLTIHDTSDPDIQKGAANIFKAAIKGKPVRKTMKRLQARHVADKTHADNTKAWKEGKENLKVYGTKHKPEPGFLGLNRLLKWATKPALATAMRMGHHARHPPVKPPGASRDDQTVLDTKEKLKAEVRQRLGADDE